MACLWIWVFGHKFLDFPQCSKYTKTGINQTSNCICILVRLHLMWNEECNTLDRWLSVYWCPWFGTFGPYLGPTPPKKIFSMPQILYNGWLSDDLETTWVRRCWMWNIKLKTFHYLICPFPWIGVFGPGFSKLPYSNARNTFQCV